MELHMKVGTAGIDFAMLWSNLMRTFMSVEGDNSFPQRGCAMLFCVFMIAKDDETVLNIFFFIKYPNMKMIYTNVQ